MGLVWSRLLCRFRRCQVWLSIPSPRLKHSNTAIGRFKASHARATKTRALCKGSPSTLPTSLGRWSPDSAAQKVAPGWSLGGVGQPVPACQVSLAAPSRLESNCQDTVRTQALRRFDRVHQFGVVLGGRPLSQLLPSLPSTDDHFPEPPSRRWQSGARAPGLGRDPGVVWPGGTTRMQSHTFWDGGWERVLQSPSATCPERDVMGKPPQPREDPSPLQHPTRNAQRKTNCSHGGPCSLAIVRPRSPLSGTESQRPRSRFPRHRGARTDRDFDWSRGIGASLEGLDQRCCWLGSSARGIPPTPLLHWHCPRRKPARPELLNGRLAVGHGYPTRRISPMQTRTETRIGGRVSADPTGATVVFFHTRGLLRFGEGLGHWRMRLRCLTANGSTPSPTRPGASFCPPRRVCSQVRCANFNGLSRLVRTRGGGQQALQPSGLHLRRGLPGTGGCLPPTRHDRGRQPAPVVQP